MRRQLVPGPVVRLTVIKAKTRPGIEARILHPQRLRATGLVVGYTEAILQDIIEAYRNSYVHFIDP